MQKITPSHVLHKHWCSELVACAPPAAPSAVRSLIAQASHSNTTPVHPSPIRLWRPFTSKKVTAITDNTCSACLCFRRRTHTQQTLLMGVPHGLFQLGTHTHIHTHTHTHTHNNITIPPVARAAIFEPRRASTSVPRRSHL
jgi:hypothetical protein